MKKLLALILLFSLRGLAAEPIQTTENENRAVLVRFFGGLTGFDQAAYRAIKSSMASLIVDGIVTQFKTTEIGLEGGSEFCVELNNDPNQKVETVLNILQAIKPTAVSVYSYESKTTCQ